MLEPQPSGVRSSKSYLSEQEATIPFPTNSTLAANNHWRPRLQNFCLSSDHFGSTGLLDFISFVCWIVLCYFCRLCQTRPIFVCKVIIKTREALSVTSERLFNSLTLVMFLSHIVCYMFQFRVIQSFSAQYNKRRNKQKDITKTNFRDVRMSKNKLKRIGIIGIISSRIGIIFILIRGQNYFHYSHSFQID